MTLDEIRARLEVLSEEMTALIHKYRLSAENPLHVIADARARIDHLPDYVRFLELSLEGRILGDEGQRLLEGSAD